MAILQHSKNTCKPTEKSNNKKQGMRLLTYNKMCAINALKPSFIQSYYNKSHYAQFNMCSALSGPNMLHMQEFPKSENCIEPVMFP